MNDNIWGARKISECKAASFPKLALHRKRVVRNDHERKGKAPFLNMPQWGNAKNEDLAAWRELWGSAVGPDLTWIRNTHTVSKTKTKTYAHTM